MNKLTRNIILGILGILILGLIAYTINRNYNKRCKGVEIIINNNHKQLLITSEEIENWITLNKLDPFEGKILSKINLSEVEARAKKSGLVKECEAYINYKAHLVVELEAYEPVARILNNENDRMLDKSGVIFPFSRHFSPTVLLLEGTYFDNLLNLQNARSKNLLSFINEINEDDFWRAQITQLNVNEFQEIHFRTLMGNETIEFGQPIKIKAKLKKLLVYYKQILAVDKWNQFSNISVKYDGQVVCN